GAAYSKCCFFIELIFVQRTVSGRLLIIMRCSISIDVLIIIRFADRNRDSGLSIVQMPPIAIAEIGVLIMRIKYVAQCDGHHAACNAYIVMRQHEVSVVVVYGYRTCSAYVLAMVG